MDAVLQRHKREGMELAVRARWLALAVIAVMIPFLDPRPEVLYYEAILLCFALIAWAQRQVARVGRSRAEIALLIADFALMTFAITVPNPFDPLDWPWAMELRFDNFQYFYVLLAGSALAYSWRTVRGIGLLTAAFWFVAVAIIWLSAEGHEALTQSAQAAFGDDPVMAAYLDPNNPLLRLRVKEVVIFLIVATTLAVVVRRYGRLVAEHAAVERERTNLARYFSPNVVDELSKNDEPLKQIRTQDIAVLFVDIVGFTRYAADRAPEEVIATLRQFHHRMEREVFRHHGTLDKYLGDGLMATFGTPVEGTRDASNALACARAMMTSIAAFNVERVALGEPPIQAGFGLDYGPAVLADLGVDRLEFAVIGNTVNIASRVEALTRPLGVQLAATQALEAAVRREGGDDTLLAGLVRHEGQAIRGLDTPMTVWTLGAHV